MEHPLSDDLTNESATELLSLMRAREVSPVEVVEAHLRRIDQINPSINAIVTLADDAIDRAREADAALSAGKAVGALHGLPLTIKDTIDTAGLRTTSGSRLRAKHVPDSDAPVVTRLKSAGAIILGKTNTPEMAIPYETDNPVFGRTNNPYDLQRTCGGSSGGEAAAIVACLSPAGIGSDLSGSIRVPAHFCGIAGLKPTTGRIPMERHTPAAKGALSLGACIGPMARRVDDLALIFSVIADPTQFEISSGAQDDIHSDRENLCRLKVAWYLDDGTAPVQEEVARAVETAGSALSDFGFDVTRANPPGVSKGSTLWIELFSRAAALEIRSMYRGREDEAGPGVASLLRDLDREPHDFEDRIENAEHLAAAVLERERLREDLLRWMKTTPLILAPVGAITAFEHGRERVNVNGESISIFRAFSYAQTFNVFGLPSVVVPVARTAKGLPIGVQIAGPPFEERTVLAAAVVIEKALGGWQKADR